MILSVSLDAALHHNLHYTNWMEKQLHEGESDKRKQEEGTEKSRRGLYICVCAHNVEKEEGLDKTATTGFHNMNRDDIFKPRL